MTVTDSLIYANQILTLKVEMYEAAATWLYSIIKTWAAPGGVLCAVAGALVTHYIKKLK